MAKLTSDIFDAHCDSQASGMAEYARIGYKFSVGQKVKHMSTDSIVTVVKQVRSSTIGTVYECQSGYSTLLVFQSDLRPAVGF